MRILLAIAAVLISSPALAGPHCTDEPESKWLPEAEFREQIQSMGHEISVLKKTAGNCYEIYGKDAAGVRIEIYFNPITAEIVRSTED